MVIEGNVGRCWSTKKRRFTGGLLVIFQISLLVKLLVESGKMELLVNFRKGVSAISGKGALDKGGVAGRCRGVELLVNVFRKGIFCYILPVR